MKILIRGILSFKKERVKKRNLSNIKIYIHRNSKSKIIKIEEEKELIRIVNVFRRFLSILFFQLLDKIRCAQFGEKLAGIASEN